MRQARMIVAAAVHDAQQPVLVQPFEADHRRMETEAVGNLDDFSIWNSQIRPRAMVRRVAERDDRVQAVVAARQLDDDENPLDRKSTRLNSSHSQISYAVFCLK